MKLGDKVLDHITGLEGILIAKIEYVNGCINYEVQPRELKDGVPAKATWVDENQLVVVSAGWFAEQCKKVELKGPAKESTATVPRPRRSFGGPGDVPPPRSTPPLDD